MGAMGRLKGSRRKGSTGNIWVEGPEPTRRTHGTTTIRWCQTDGVHWSSGFLGNSWTLIPLSDNENPQARWAYGCQVEAGLS